MQYHVRMARLCTDKQLYGQLTLEVGINEAQAGVCIAISERWTRNIIWYEELITVKTQHILLNLRIQNVVFFLISMQGFDKST